jgi:PAS domain S-box-containing protein
MPDSRTHSHIERLNFELLAADLPAPIMVLDQDLNFVFANAAYCLSVKSPAEELVGRYVFEAFQDSPERVAPILEKFKATLRGETTYLEEVPFQIESADGTLEDRIWQATQKPLKDAQGRVTHLVQHCEDVTEKVALRRQNELITSELNHRVRNTLSVVQSVSALSAGNSETIDEFNTAFSGRLAAMGRNFNEISKSDWSGIDLETIISTELYSFVSPDSDVVNLTGPKIKLGLKETKDAALVIHELITNAAKYGFLSIPEGHLHVAWHLDGDCIQIDWQESGLSDLKAPTRRGFGFTLVEMLPGVSVERECPSSDNLRQKAA